jgi:hypothetical protein
LGTEIHTPAVVCTNSALLPVLKVTLPLAVPFMEPPDGAKTTPLTGLAAETFATMQ